MKSPRTYSQTDRQTEIFFSLVLSSKHTNHEHLSKGENFFFTHAITMLSVFTYSVCDEKVKKIIIQFFFFIEGNPDIIQSQIIFEVFLSCERQYE